MLINFLFKKRGFSREQVQQFYKDIFGTDKGRVVLQHLAMSSKFDEVTYCPGDPHETSFREGRRQVILHILNMIETNPVDFIRNKEEDDEVSFI